MDIEQRLRESLAAREPGADFETAVMARVLDPQQRTAPPRRGFAWRIPAALAATVLAAAVGLHWYVADQRVVHDREQLLLALAITSHELDQVRQRLTRTDETRTQENGT